jgi:hypothetical protein
MKKTYLASAMIHAMSALKTGFGLFKNKASDLNKIHDYQHPYSHGGKRTGFAAARRMAKKNRNVRARAKR